MWPFDKPKTDARRGRMVFLIECLLNQNARDRGAAQAPAVTPGLIQLLTEKDVGMVQISCPEMNCLGFARKRLPGQSIREALETPTASACCEHLANTTAERIRHYTDQGFEVLCILGGNSQSPACAVQPGNDETRSLTGRSGVFMQALARELESRVPGIPFRGIRDADPGLLAEDLSWLKRLL